MMAGLFHLRIGLLLSLLFSSGLPLHGQEGPLGIELEEALNAENWSFSHLVMMPTERLDKDEVLVPCWQIESERKDHRGNLGLRFKPVDDQNIYLLYQYELKHLRSKTEIGFSVNSFNAFSIKYSQSFAFNGFR